jgi:hypothetical protein
MPLKYIRPTSLTEADRPSLPEAGVIEQRDVGAGQLFLEFLQCSVEAGLVEVELRATADHEEAERQ